MARVRRRRKSTSRRRRSARRNPTRAYNTWPTRRKRKSKKRKKAKRMAGRNAKGQFTRGYKRRKGKRKSTKRRSLAGRNAKGQFTRGYSRKRKGKRKYVARGPRKKSLRRARSKIRWAKRTKPGSRSRKALKAYGLRSNPGAMIGALKGVLPIAATFYGSKLVSSKLANIGPVANILAKLPMGGKLAGPILSGAVLAGVHYGTKKGALSKHRGGMMFGAAFALIDATIAAFAPPTVASMFGVQAVGEYFPMNDYVAQSDYVAMDGYDSTDQSPRQLHEVWGVHGIEEELGSDYGSLTSAW